MKRIFCCHEPNIFYDVTKTTIFEQQAIDTRIEKIEITEKLFDDLEDEQGEGSSNGTVQDTCEMSTEEEGPSGTNTIDTCEEEEAEARTREEEKRRIEWQKRQREEYQRNRSGV